MHTSTWYSIIWVVATCQSAGMEQNTETGKKKLQLFYGNQLRFTRLGIVNGSPNLLRDNVKC